jgi:hypothetical protein
MWSDPGFRFVALNVLVGMAIGAMLGAGAIVFDLAGLGVLKGSTDVASLAIFMFLLVSAFTGGMIQSAIAIMGLGREPNGDGSWLSRMQERLTIGKAPDQR